jgi:N-methylhydantoinase A
MGSYVASLTESLAEIEMTAPWTIMKSNGGAMKAEAAVANPIQTAQSGPAGGMIAAAALGNQAGELNLLTLDMGGTSADVGLITDGAQKHTTEYEIEWGIPAAIPLIDIKSIGAGGGSIAWIDAGGFLRVGPQSARALPGPACYGRGGSLPTVTDANVVLGRIDPGNFLGGRMTLDRAAAEAAIAPLADRLGMSIVELAAAITGIADENMAAAVKMISIERGHDPRRFTLFGFGGAGPLHACAVARALRVPKVLIPIFPGNASALGMLIAERRVDKVWTQAFRSTHVDEALVGQQFQLILDAALAELRNEGFAGEPDVTYSINMRYLGQNYEQDVPIELDGADGMLQTAYRTFEEHHAALYGYKIENEVIELVSFRVTVRGARPAIRLAVEPDRTVEARRPDRQVYFRGHGFVPASVWNRYSLPLGCELDGPAVLEEPGSTTLIEPGMRAQVLGDGQLLIAVDPATEAVA